MNNTIINYGVGFLDVNQNQVTHKVTSIHFDNFKHTVKVVIEKGIEISQPEMTMEYAQEIGFINIQALKSYCK